MPSETNSTLKIAHGGQGQDISYAETNARAHRLARAMTALDVRPDDAVVSLMPNCPELAVARLGNSLVGGAFLAIDPEISPSQLRAEIRRSSARIILAHSAKSDGKARQQLLLEAIPELRSAPDCTSLDLACAPHLKAIVMLGTGVNEPFVSENLLAELSQLIPDASAMLKARISAFRPGFGRQHGLGAPSADCRSSAL